MEELKQEMKKKIFIKHFLLVALCLTFMMCIYGGLSINKLGLYSDDWERMDLYTFTKTEGLRSKILLLTSVYPGVYYRGTHIFLMPFSSLVGDFVGSQILGMHLLSIAINLLTLVAVVYLMSKFSQNSLFAFLCSVFIFTMPGRSATFFWPSTQVEMLSILFFFLALNIHFSLNTNKWISATLVFICTLISTWSYEVTIFLPGIFLLLIFLERSRRTVTHLFSSLAGVVLVLFFKFYVYSNLLNLEVVKETQSYITLSDIFSGVIVVAKSLAAQINVASLFSYWKEYIGTPQLFIFLTILIVALVTILFVDYATAPSDRNLPILLIGLGILLGYIIVITPVFGSGSIFSIYGKNSRFTSLPMMGLGFIICYLFSSYMLSQKKIRFFAYALFVIFISLNLKGLHSERLAYVKSWEIQKEILSNIDFSAVEGDRDVMIFVSQTNELSTTDYSVPVFEDYWTLSYSFSLTSGNPNIVADFATYPYKRLDRNEGYQSKYWDKLYYQKDSIYQVDLRHRSPKVTPIQQGIY